GARCRRRRRLFGHMCAYRVRCHELAPRSSAPRMPVPLLHLRSEGRSQGGQRTCSTPSAGAAIENSRWPRCCRQAIHTAGRLSADLIRKIEWTSCTSIACRVTLAYLTRQSETSRHYRTQASQLSIVVEDGVAAAQQPGLCAPLRHPQLEPCSLISCV